MIQNIFEVKESNYDYLVENLAQFISTINLVMPLINSLSNITFFVKNVNAEYELVNNPFADRCNIRNINNIIGKRSEEVFAEELGLSYTEQDFSVMHHRRRIANRLELHSYKAGILGWCMTTKVPIFNHTYEVVGIAGISIDLQEDKLIRPDLNSKLKKVIAYIDQHFQHAIMIQELAKIANLSISQLDRQFKAIFQMTPLQFIQKKRLEHAIQLLAKDISITDISFLCGYTDHSAFSRKFKELTSLTPSQFKKQLNTSN